MQCARCHGVMTSPKRVGKKPRPKALYRSNPQISSATVSRGEWDELRAAFQKDGPEPTAGFFELYSRSLGVCVVSGLFSAAVLFFLSFSVLHAGAVALPFLGIFATGLLLSVGLPFKMYREYKRFSV